MRNFVNLNVNPCNMCMPMGAAGVFKGIEHCMVLMHGSQGCSTYIRRHMATHYNEPIDIASSSLNEKGTVYGGSANLKKALKNVIKLYRPRVVGITTTCLAETIGEDLGGIINEFFAEEKIKGIDCLAVSSPGYGGSQYKGHYYTARKTVEHFVKNGGKSPKVNVIVGSMSPGDIRHLKEILSLFDIAYTLFPDISETLDGGCQEYYNRMPEGGTPISALKEMGKAAATLEIGAMVADEDSPGLYLKEAYGIPLYRLPLPIGLQNTDALMEALAGISGRGVPMKIRKERARYLDAMIDAHKYNAEGRVGIFGDPELIYAATSICLENCFTPCVVASGPANGKILPALDSLGSSFNRDFIKLADTDFETISKHVQDTGVNLLIGPSDGAFMTEKFGIPLVRTGFPVHDRMGAQRKVVIGYTGSMQLLDELTNILLDQKHQTFRANLHKAYWR
ncbi:nitrogenase component 1 [Bacillota bacterium LX-D]|nr:nitrogenase component 1 [Bacillota bacterium LX-D]